VLPTAKLDRLFNIPLLSTVALLALPSIKVMGTLQENLQSTQELSNKILNGQLAVGMTPGAVAGEMIGGAGIGSAISVMVSGLVTYLQYKSGNITFDEMKSKLAKDGVKGAITSGALAALSLFIPGGLIGAGRLATPSA
jgi:hypothetical protein